MGTFQPLLRIASPKWYDRYIYNFNSYKNVLKLSNICLSIICLKFGVQKIEQTTWLFKFTKFERTYDRVSNSGRGARFPQSLAQRPHRDSLPVKLVPDLFPTRYNRWGCDVLWVPCYYSRIIIEIIYETNDESRNR